MDWAFLLKEILGFDVISSRRGVAELFKICVKHRFLKHLITLHLMVLPILGRFYAYGYDKEWRLLEMSKEEVVGSEWDDLRSLLFQLRQVSEAHFKRWRMRQETDEFYSWSIFEQLNHVHSEVSEVYAALRKGKHDSEIIDEVCDIIFSAITAAHVMGYDDDSILRSMVRCLRKIQERVKEAAAR